MINYGESTSYSLSVLIQLSGRNESLRADDIVTYTITPGTLTLASNSSTKAILNVNFLQDSYDGVLGFTFTVIVESMDFPENNNFIEIDILSVPLERITLTTTDHAVSNIKFT